MAGNPESMRPTELSTHTKVVEANVIVMEAALTIKNKEEKRRWRKNAGLIWAAKSFLLGKRAESPK